MDLSELADTYLGSEPGVNLSDLGPSSVRLHEEVQNEAYTLPFIATAFWRSYIEGPAFTSALMTLRASRSAVRIRESYVVRHGNGTRHDLLVLDPDFPASEPVAKQVKPSRVDIRDGWRRLWDHDHWNLPWTTLDVRPIPDATDEMMRVQQFGVIIAPLPSVELTSCPTPGWPISQGDEGQPAGTVGAIVRDGEGRRGVTAALHTLRGSDTVIVNGRGGQVVSRHEGSDSCFIELPHMDRPRRWFGLSGPLFDVAPRIGESVRFDAIGSGRKTTTVTAWSPKVLMPQRFSQSRVFTPRVTAPGDSGAALIDSEDHILGFCLHRTAEGAVLEYSAWAWGETVLTVHDLFLLS